MDYVNLKEFLADLVERPLVALSILALLVCGALFLRRVAKPANAGQAIAFEQVDGALIPLRQGCFKLEGRSTAEPGTRVALAVRPDRDPSGVWYLVDAEVRVGHDGRWSTPPIAIDEPLGPFSVYARLVQEHEWRTLRDVADPAPEGVHAVLRELTPVETEE